MLVANTKEMWNVFIQACKKQPELLDAKDPLDSFVEYAVKSVTDALPG